MYKADTNLDPDNNGKPYYGAVFVYLAYQCASTFRRTDYVGGCNGARIRMEPQASWPVNFAMDKAMAVLQPVKTKFGNALSWADLIVAAGQVALEEAGSKPLSFCPGRSDADAATPADPSVLSPNLNMSSTPLQQAMWLHNSGLTAREMVVLSARPRSLVHQGRLGYTPKTWSTDASKLSNEYFQVLLSEKWENVTSPSGLFEYKAAGKDLYMVQTDMNIRYESDWLALVQEYAASNDLFLTDFSKAWTKLMNIDRFNGPTGNVCNPPTPSPDSSSSSGLASWAVALISVLVTLVVCAFVYCACLRQPAKKQDTLLA
jgi:catalase (peroxidase I)